MRVPKTLYMRKIMQGAARSTPGILPIAFSVKSGHGVGGHENRRRQVIFPCRCSKIADLVIFAEFDCHPVDLARFDPDQHIGLHIGAKGGGCGDRGWHR